MAVSITVFPAMVRLSQSRPTPDPTEHCAPGTGPGRVTVTSAAEIRLFQPGAITFQKNTDGAAGSPVEDAKSFVAPVSPGSSTPAMR